MTHPVLSATDTLSVAPGSGISRKPSYSADMGYSELYEARRQLQELIDVWTKDQDIQRRNRNPEMQIAFGDKITDARKQMEQVSLALRAKLARDLAHP